MRVIRALRLARTLRGVRILRVFKFFSARRRCLGRFRADFGLFHGVLGGLMPRRSRFKAVAWPEALRSLLVSIMSTLTSLIWTLRLRQ